MDPDIDYSTISALKLPYLKEYNVRDMRGYISGDLTVIEYAGRNERNKPQWKCKCKCGNEIIVPARELQRRHRLSCGKCNYHFRREQELRKFHTIEEYKLQHVLNAMKERCFNPENPEYHRYGGRGITICPEWLGDTSVFVNWALTHGYRIGLTLERQNNDGNYTPQNCVWDGRIAQMNNISKNHLIPVASGERCTRAQAARIVGIDYERARTIGDQKLGALVDREAFKQKLSLFDVEKTMCQHFGIGLSSSII